MKCFILSVLLTIITLQPQKSICNEVNITIEIQKELTCIYYSKCEFYNKVIPDLLLITNDLDSINFLLAQAILESNWGKSSLAYRYNNYYGIKAWKGGIPMYGLEIIDEEEVQVLSYWNTYNSFRDCLQARLAIKIKLEGYGTFNLSVYQRALKSILKEVDKDVDFVWIERVKIKVK